MPGPGGNASVVAGVIGIAPAFGDAHPSRTVRRVLQALLPVPARAPGPPRVTVAGGTDVRAAPPLDCLGHVLLANVNRMGSRVECRLVCPALAGGGAFTTREITNQARIAIGLIEQFLPVRFTVCAAGMLTRVEVRRR